MVFQDKEGRRVTAMGRLTNVGGHHPARPESDSSGDEKAE